MPKTAQYSTLTPEIAQECLAGLDVGLLMVGPQGEIRYANSRATEILDLRVNDIVGARVFELFELNPACAMGPDAEVWRTFSLPPTQILSQRGEKELTLECRVLPTGKSTDGGWGVLLIDDASESMEEREFQRNIDRFSSIGNLSAIMAHEIRNPLTGIRTTIQFVQTKLPDDSTLSVDLEDAIKELDRIEQFTTDLLQFARPKIFELAETDINDVISNVLSHVNLSCAELSIHVKEDLTSELPVIPLDAHAIHQAVLNIIINAIEAMPDGGTLRVSSSTRRYRNRRAVEVAIADTGTGISQEVLEKIYDPFFTTRGAGGTGLGLSISLQIVKEHGGRIYVRNRSQGGVIFRLSFPVPEKNEAGETLK